jgi:hypothetical protein
MLTVLTQMSPIAISVSPRRSRRAEPEAGSSGCVQLAKIPLTSATTRTLPAIYSTRCTAILMREHGIGRICIRDTDFNQFPFLEVIDPLRP